MSQTNIRLQVLVSEGCVNAEPAIALARAVGGRFGPRVSVERVEVNSEVKAATLGFLGSPSIRVNGEDVEGRVSAQGALCCRLYDDGTGVPPVWMVEAAVLRATKPNGLLFLCVANSARSQMAEGIARSMAPDDVKVWSAGSRPTHVRPEAIAALAEIGIDLTSHRSKNVSEIPADQVDTVITLCREEECPLFLGKATRLQWGMPDPAAIRGDEAHRHSTTRPSTLDAFRETRDGLQRRLAAVFGRQAPG